MNSSNALSPFLDLRLADCMEVMKQYPDHHFDLAIVDPPYGINMGHGAGQNHRTSDQIIKGDWDKCIPPKEYFEELTRVSKNQIIWGGNYFIDHLRNTKCFIFWEKTNTKGGHYADGELAWTNFNRVAKMVTLSSMDPSRFHPTQKPVKLYSWILENFAEKGMKILDTHMGSGSVAIACHYYGAYLTACEISPEYFEKACERIVRETSQLKLF